MDRDLIEKLLTAQVLTLALAMKAEAAGRGMRGSDKIYEAIQAVRDRQAELISRLLAPPEPETEGQ